MKKTEIVFLPFYAHPFRVIWSLKEWQKRDDFTVIKAEGQTAAARAKPPRSAGRSADIQKAIKGLGRAKA